MIVWYVAKDAACPHWRAAALETASLCAAVLHWQCRGRDAAPRAFLVLLSRISGPECAAAASAGGASAAVDVPAGVPAGSAAGAASGDCAAPATGATAAVASGVAFVSAVQLLLRQLCQQLCAGGFHTASPSG